MATINNVCMYAAYEILWNVESWPGQGSSVWDQRVPSVVLYDSCGQVSALFCDWDGAANNQYNSC